MSQFVVSNVTVENIISASSASFSMVMTDVISVSGSNIYAPFGSENDTFVLESSTQSLLNKTILSDTNVVEATRLGSFTISSATPSNGDYLYWNGSSWFPNTINVSGVSRITSTVTTTDATPTELEKIINIADNSTSIIEVYVKAYSSSATQYGVWKRTLTVTKVSGVVTIRETNADVDKTSSGLNANSISFSVNGGDIDLDVTGIAATTIDWKSAYEIII